MIFRTQADGKLWSDHFLAGAEMKISDTPKDGSDIACPVLFHSLAHRHLIPSASIASCNTRIKIDRSKQTASALLMLASISCSDLCVNH